MMLMTVFKDYLAGKATAEQVKAEVARQRQGMKKPGPPYKQPDLNDVKWTPPSIFEEVTIAQATGQVSREEADDLLA
ncbi:hypothetical protein CAQUA_05080 [Corynebacterium aquatimens]|nr:hypothetical protein CAQUA_05080 [Corynebacterium aquatimens]